MSKYYDKFINTLQEMFQFDNEDLDFGLYRIMNQKREEIRRFLQEDLLPQVKQALQSYDSTEQSDLTAVEAEIYSDLTTFFQRYYNNGDFLSNRRYKNDVYAIPYEGEEVKLHWANADQYYVKTTENFRNYSFSLTSGRKVSFILTDATTEQNNNKEQKGKERHFALAPDNFMEEESGELNIRFEYRLFEDKVKQEALKEQTVRTIREYPEHRDWIAELTAPHEKNRNKSVLERHLDEYTAIHKYDYFIHKNLGGFLRRELNFFIKSELMNLDDLNTENEKRLEQYVSKIKVVKDIGHKIISFLEQIENFQKKLWLKKKFVVDAQYCITLDRVPKELYPEIVRNEKQLDEWIRLFAIDEIEEDLSHTGFTRPLTEAFLHDNPYLLLDTVFFDQGFKDRLLAGFENLDEQLDGLLLNSENFQGLNLLAARYNRQVSLIYIDPPYNTDSNAIVYKNGYKDSSWLSLMNDRLEAAKATMNERTVLCVAIDKAEQERLGLLLQQLFPGHDVHCIPVVHNPRGIQGKNFSYTHEYVYYVIPVNMDVIKGKKLPPEEWEYSNLRNWGGESERKDGKTLFYPIYVNLTMQKVVGVGEVPGDDVHPQANVKLNDEIVQVWPVDANGVERKWRYSIARSTREMDELQLRTGNDGTINVWVPKQFDRYKTVWISEKYDASVYGKQLLTSMIENAQFSFPKSLYTVMECVGSVSLTEDDGIVLDFFAGSGTTGHAVIQQNRLDQGRRKYILAEMGNYFQTVTKPRIQKAIYSKDWRNGKPVSREGSSHMFKYMKLESYEDTLNNLELRRTEQQQLAIDFMEPAAREQYVLSYMLEIESRDSRSLLNVSLFEDPFDYKLKIAEGNETVLKTVDLVDTFNYLLGLVVRQVEARQGVKVVRGQTRSGEQVVILWRNVQETGNDALEQLVKSLNISEIDRIYVNGDNGLNNLRKDSDRWKVTLIEEEFKRLMFDQKTF